MHDGWDDEQVNLSLLFPTIHHVVTPFKHQINMVG
jgi:hypothetical protein